MTDTRKAHGLIPAKYLRTVRVVLAFAAMFAPAVLAILSAQAQTFTVLYSFTGGADGGYPYAGLILDRAGNLYGTTAFGGASNNGTVFKISKSGKEIVLHSFRGRDGANPYAGLVRDSQGNLYGTTGSGGVPSGYGTVFRLSKTGRVTVLHKFRGGTTDGCHPNGGLVRDKAGNLYGTTWKCGASGLGTVFKVDTSGTETVLHNFAGGPTDGASPSYGNLLMDKTGSLYGVTSDGGSFPAGTVYMLSPSGTFTLLHSFAVGVSDGCYAYGTPVMDKKGTLYGTTEICGSSGYGIVWKVSQGGSETVLHNFAGAFSDGAYPLAGVILDGKGNFYGDAQDGGAAYLGAVYKLSKSGTVTLLHSFAGSDGEYPFGGLIRDANGNLFGTTLRGGSANCSIGCGTVWKIAP